MKKTKYIIVSPVRNEEAYIEKTILAVIAQTVLPDEWIIVNDGSTDSTRNIIETFLPSNSWIKLINLPDRGFRQPGKGIVEAFYEGFNSTLIKDWEFVVKLDCDLHFQPDYFENIFREFEKNPKLGIASGKTYTPVDNNTDNLKIEPCPNSHTRGPSKIYKRECFDKIGGIMPMKGWDTLDDVIARVKGFEVRSFKEFVIIHFRPIGKIAKDENWIKFSSQMGASYYRIGYHPLFMFIKSVKFLLVNKPYLLFGINMFINYLAAMFRRDKKIADKEVVAMLRKIQIRRMLLIEN